jgi:serine/threonine-protein kinase
MGVVYKGEDAALERTVAIKTILMTFASEEHAGYLARFRQEARALGALKPPVDHLGLRLRRRGRHRVHGDGIPRGPGAARNPRRGAPAPSFAVDVAAQVAEGLAFAHARGIVHRDVKPGNIMVLEGGRAKIMDFGIAAVRASDVKTQTGLMLGSPRYMSPEQILGQAADHARTSSRSASCSTRCSRARRRSRAGHPAAHVPGVQRAPDAAQPPESRVPEVLDLIVAKALEKDPRRATRTRRARDRPAACAKRCRARLGYASDRRRPGPPVQWRHDRRSRRPRRWPRRVARGALGLPPRRSSIRAARSRGSRIREEPIARASRRGTRRADCALLGRRNAADGVAVTAIALAIALAIAQRREALGLLGHRGAVGDLELARALDVQRLHHAVVHQHRVAVARMPMPRA